MVVVTNQGSDGLIPVETDTGEVIEGLMPLSDDDLYRVVYFWFMSRSGIRSVLESELAGVRQGYSSADDTYRVRGRVHSVLSRFTYDIPFEFELCCDVVTSMIMRGGSDGKAV